MRSLALFSLFLVFLASNAFSEMRTWTLKSGKKAQAELVNLSLDSATFRLESGKEKTFPINKLSEDDIKNIFSLIKFSRYSRNRSWTISSESPKKLKARLHSGNRREVFLKCADGKLVNVKASALSREDQDYLKKYLKTHSATSGNSRKLSVPERLRTWTIQEPPKRMYGRIEGWDGENIFINLRREKKTETVPMTLFSAKDIKYLKTVLSRTVVVYKRDLERMAKQEEIREARKKRAAEQAEILEARKKEAAKQAKIREERRKKEAENARKDIASKNSKETPLPGVAEKKEKVAGKTPDKTAAPSVGKSNPEETPTGMNETEKDRAYSTAKKAAALGVLIVGIIVFLILNIAFAVICLWIAASITRCETSFLVLLLTSIVSGLLSMIPYVGIFIAGPVQLIMIMLISKTRFIDTLFMIIVANFIYVIASLAFIAQIMSLMGL